MMRLPVFCFVLLSLSFTASAQKYLFYLHGRIVEDKGATAIDDKNGFGAYQYNDIVAEFRNAGFIVLSEVRPKNTVVEDYARKVAHQVDSLLQKSVKPQNITVLGSSKGSAIAMQACTYIKNKAVNYVLMSACSENANPELELTGNILSIYETSDTWAQSCQANKMHSKLPIPHYKEVALKTGLRHGYLYKPLKEWIQPSIKWANGVYD